MLKININNSIVKRKNPNIMINTINYFDNIINLDKKIYDKIYQMVKI